MSIRDRQAERSQLFLRLQITWVSAIDTAYSKTSCPLFCQSVGPAIHYSVSLLWGQSCFSHLYHWTQVCMAFFRALLATAASPDPSTWLFLKPLFNLYNHLVTYIFIMPVEVDKDITFVWCVVWVLMLAIKIRIKPQLGWGYQSGKLLPMKPSYLANWLLFNKLWHYQKTEHIHVSEIVFSWNSDVSPNKIKSWN